MSALSPSWSVGRWARHSGQTFALTEAKEQRACGSKDGRHLRPISSDSCRPLDPPLSCDGFFCALVTGTCTRQDGLTHCRSRLCLHSCPAGGSGDKLSHFISVDTVCSQPHQNHRCSWFLCDVWRAVKNDTARCRASCLFLLLFMIKKLKLNGSECRLSTRNARHLFKTVWNAFNLILVRDIFGICLSYNYS